MLQHAVSLIRKSDVQKPGWQPLMNRQ